MLVDILGVSCLAEVVVAVAVGVVVVGVVVAAVSAVATVDVVGGSVTDVGATRFAAEVVVVAAGSFLSSSDVVVDELEIDDIVQVVVAEFGVVVAAVADNLGITVAADWNHYIIVGLVGQFHHYFLPFDLTIGGVADWPCYRGQSNMKGIYL